MKRGLIVAPAWLTVLAVFNSGTLRWQSSTAAHCAGSVQQRHTALAVVQHKQDIYSTLRWQ